MEEEIKRSSDSGIALERNANPKDKLKLTIKLTNPITPIPKIPQNNMVSLT